MTDAHGTRLRARALVLAVAAAGAHPAAGAAERAGASVLRAELRALLPQAAREAPTAPVSTVQVTSCADDNGPATLRTAVAAAGEGDTIDLSGLSCSTITLAQGAIPVLLDDLAVIGPGAERLAIDAAGSGRAFVHAGSGALRITRLTVRNGASRVSGNHVTGGGCIASSGNVVLDHAVVSGCYASGEGVYGGGIFAGGLYLYTSTLRASVGRGNDPYAGTATFGGGAYAGLVTLVDSTVSGNRADHVVPAPQSGYEIGGGAFANYGGTILRSTIDGNYSGGRGGGVAAFAGSIEVVDSTLSGNVARSASGGALDLRVSGLARIASSTIAGNEAASAGGVYLRWPSLALELQSTILSGNAAVSGAADIDTAFALVPSGANNLVGEAGAGIALPPATLHADPLLQPLAANGGPTRTRALSPASPALDAGNNAAALATDQRGPGFPRVLGGAPDIGAFEGVALPAVAPVPAPLASRLALGLLAGLLVVIGSRALRRKSVTVFTRPSPPRGHSSHT